jgi:hypothetical protein
VKSASFFGSVGASCFIVDFKIDFPGDVELVLTFPQIFSKFDLISINMAPIKRLHVLPAGLAVRRNNNGLEII